MSEDHVAVLGIQAGVVAVFGAVAVYMFGKHGHPPTGYAVTGLGIVAIVISLLPPPHRFAKVGWLIVAGALVLLEITAISRDRDDDRTERENAARQADIKFTITAITLRRNLGATLERVEGVTLTANGILEKSVGIQTTVQRDLAVLTGAGSYPCVIPDQMAMAGMSVNDKIPFLIWNYGPNPLTGVEVAIAGSIDEYRQARKTGQSNPTVVGTLPPRSSSFAKSLPAKPPPPLNRQTLEGSYRVQIFAQNGFYTEWIGVRKSSVPGPPWAFKYSGYKQVLLERPIKGYPKAAVGSLVPQRLPDCQLGRWSDGTE